jgi:arylsulfatase
LERPNILLITTDQQRADMLGCYGNPVIRTPNVDRMAQEGVRFDRAYVANPLCMPSRATIMTGQFPSKHGVYSNGIPLREEIPTLPGALTDAGYYTAALGKLHLTPYGGNGYRESVADWETQPYGDWHGPYYGFQEVHLILGHNGPAGHFGEWLQEHHPDVPEKFWQIEGRRGPANTPITWKSAVPVEAHSSTWVGNVTVDFLRSRPADQPFFAWASFPDPHHPFCPPEEIADMYNPADVPLPPRRPGDLDSRPPQYKAWYEEGVRHEGFGGNFIPAKLSEANLREMIAFNYAEVTLIDQNVGRILAELDRQGLAENTIVIFTADHGELLGEHGLLLKGPFMCEGLLRVPFVVCWPRGQGEAGAATEALVSLTDLMPTLLAAAGVAIPDGVQGRSFLPVLAGEAPAVRDAVLTEFHSTYFPDLNLRTLRTPDYKLVYYPGKPYGELYDLQKDPDEFENRWDDAAYAQVRNELMQRLVDELIGQETDRPGPIAHA